MTLSDLVSVSGGIPTHPNILTTAPELAGQAKSLAHIGSELGVSKIALVTSSHATVASFLAEATTLGIRVQEILEVIPRQVNIGPAVSITVQMYIFLKLFFCSKCRFLIHILNYLN